MLPVHPYMSLPRFPLAVHTDTLSQLPNLATHHLSLHLVVTSVRGMQHEPCRNLSLPRRSVLASSNRATTFVCTFALMPVMYAPLHGPVWSQLPIVL